jgi:hypothetical protein
MLAQLFFLNIHYWLNFFYWKFPTD